jgi:hypothetical protein
MRTRLALALVALVVAGPLQHAWHPWRPAWGEDATRFISALEDVPLMPGLTELPDAAVRLDTAEGRIVVAWATGAVDEAGIAAFYARTLPQLGWTAEGRERYRREGEALQLDMFRGEILTLRYTLSPE